MYKGNHILRTDIKKNTLTDGVKDSPKEEKFPTYHKTKYLFGVEEIDKETTTRKSKENEDPKIFITTILRYLYPLYIYRQTLGKKLTKPMDGFSL